MSGEPAILRPDGDYELLDFGGGRRLERFGEVIVERPAAHAARAPARPDWRPHWAFDSPGGRRGRWVQGPRSGPRRWNAVLEGRPWRLGLGPGGELGHRPERVACGRWVAERLARPPAGEPLRVLNLFGGPGEATAAALAAGARVTHVTPSEAELAMARENLPEAGVSWVLEDVSAFVQRALDRKEAFDAIVADPPPFFRGPGSRVWDIQRDFARLVRNLPRLAAGRCRGVWISLHTAELAPESVARLVFEAFPAQRVARAELAVPAADGAALAVGEAVHWAEEAGGAERAGAVALDATALEERLEVYLDPALSSRRTAAGPARALAAFKRRRQEFVLRWVEVTAHTNAELAYQVAFRGARALELMDEAGAEAWIVHATDVYDRSGLHAAVRALADVEAFARGREDKLSGVALDDVAGVLQGFVHGLAGRALRLEPGGAAYTDTETLYLPEVISRFASAEENFRLYKATVVHLWAQVWFGTWRGGLTETLARYPDPGRAAAVFHALERLRLDACIERELPGAARMMRALRAAEGEPPLPEAWAPTAARLRGAEAGVEESHAWLPALYDAALPAPVCYQGVLHPEVVERVWAERREREQRRLRQALARLAEEARGRAAREPARLPEAPPRFELREPEPGRPDRASFELELDGQPLIPPDDARATMASILQDLGEIPEEYLVPAGDGAYPHDERPPERDPAEVWKGVYHEDGAYLYNEWDFERRHYRKRWAVLREVDVHPRYDDFVTRTLKKHAGLVKTLRRTFEALRDEDRMLKKQPEGDDVDIDALVEAYADAQCGGEMTDRLFTRIHREERNIAVMFMVDMSGSTKGWINDAEREALVLLCESLETLGDRYAIYGFSGMTRKKCELYRIKRFDEPYGEEVRARISGIKPQDYTRMGVTIRHLTQLFKDVEARTRLLITLSDGKPDDFDGYRGPYGIEDTRQALMEAQREGVHPFCITIDTEAHEYLPHMYGAVNYTVIDEVRKLPLKVSDIYRKLTT